MNINAELGRAELILLPNGTIPFNQVDALAASPDGARLYAIDRYPPLDGGTGMMGYYDFQAASFTEVGLVRNGGEIISGVVLAAFGPNGRFYVLSQDTSSVYTVNIETDEATMIGPIINQGRTTTIARSSCGRAWCSCARSLQPAGYSLSSEHVGIGRTGQGRAA